MTAALPRRPGVARRLQVTEHGLHGVRRREGRVAVEEPLEVRLKSPLSPPGRVTVLMRTPGHDFELAAGWLAGEGLLRTETLRSVAYCTDNSVRRDQEFNVVTVEAGDEQASPSQGVGSGSACGVSGADALAAVTGPPPLDLQLDPDVLASLLPALGAQQPLAERTGGAHGAALFDTDGTTVVTREDISRHNALDKCLGHLLLNQLPPPPIAALSSGVDSELVRKAVVGGLTVIVAHGAPTSLAVDIAAATGRTLVCLVEPDQYVVYAGGDS